MSALKIDDLCIQSFKLLISYNDVWYNVFIAPKDIHVMRHIFEPKNFLSEKKSYHEYLSTYVFLPSSYCSYHMSKIAKAMQIQPNHHDLAKNRNISKYITNMCVLPYHQKGMIICTFL